VIIEYVSDNTKYSDSLKEFLSPTFQNATNKQQKKIGKHLKIYA